MITFSKVNKHLLFIGFLPILAFLFSCNTQKTTNYYNVTWQNEDGTILEIDENVEYGTIPTYDGIIPTKEGNNQYHYNFIGWNSEISKVTEDVTYVAVFEQKLNLYTITWQNEDGTILEIDENVEYGTIPTYDGIIPTKEGNKQYHYNFIGWNSEISKVTEDVTYVAVFEQNLNLFTVTWQNEDGTTLEIDENKYGTIPTYDGIIPTKEGNNQYHYNFIGWNSEISKVTEDVTYVAVFEQNLNIFTVTWKNEDGTTLEIDENVEYGTIPTYDGVTPTKEGNKQYHYNFIGWDKDISEAIEDVNYIAKFSSSLTKYKLSFETFDGSVIDEIELENGSSVSLPLPQNGIEKKSFAGWYDKTFTKEYAFDIMPTENLTLYAKWIDYEVKLSFSEISEFSVKDEITSKTFNSSAIDTDGNAINVDVKLSEGEISPGNTVSFTLIATGLYEISTTETISNIKVYGNPTITFNNEKVNMNTIDKVNSDLFSATSLDSFGASLPVSITLNSGSLESGNIVTFKLSSTDKLGNKTEMVTSNIKVYSKDDININYDSSVKNIKLSLIGEELNISALDSFNESCDVKIELAEGFTFEAGNIINFYIVAKDVSGNVKKSELISDVKIYDIPTITLNNDINVIHQNDDPYDFFTAKNSFNEEIEINVTMTSGSLTLHNDVTYTITAIDEANNICTKNYQFKVLGEEESLLKLYIGDTIVAEQWISKGEDYTFPSGYYWINDGMILTNPDGINVKSWDNESNIYEISSIEDEEGLLVLAHGSQVFPEYSTTKKIYLLEGVEEIKKELFANWTLLETVVLPDSLVKINEYAFYNCSSLKNINIPENVTTIGNNAFMGCSSLESIVLPNNLLSINASAFADCTSLKNITIPSGLETVGSGVFKNCSSLETIYWDASNCYMAAGRYESFLYGCPNLKNFIIGKNVSTIPSFLLYECGLLESLTVDKENKIYDSRDNCNAVIETITNKLVLGTSISTIPSSVKTIGDYAFEGSFSLKSINIPFNVETVGYGIFANCPVLESITVDDNNLYYDSRNNCNAIIETNSNTLIAGCGKTIIPNDVEKIEESAFYGCLSLTNIYIPDSVIEIGIWAFEYCENLETVNLSKNIKTIGDFAFYGCKKLTTIDLYNVETICFAAFGKTGLESITLPNTLSSIGEFVFFQNYNLNIVNNYSKIEVLSDSFGLNGATINEYNVDGKYISNRPKTNANLPYILNEDNYNSDEVDTTRPTHILELDEISTYNSFQVWEGARFYILTDNVGIKSLRIWKSSFIYSLSPSEQMPYSIGHLNNKILLQSIYEMGYSYQLNSQDFANNDMVTVVYMLVYSEEDL